MRPIVLACLLAACSGTSAGSGKCGGLSLAECRLTDGCKPDTCFACLCDQSYRGCLAASQTAKACPQLGCPSAECCATQAQCTNGATTCAPPGTPRGCGACNTQPGDCTTDAQCKSAHGATFVCDPIVCSCSDQKQCVPGCTNNMQCGDPLLVCDLATARCVAHPCAGGCPANSDCSGQTCVPRACASDLECDGYCVEGM